MKTAHLQVSGMSCGHCVSAVEKALKSQQGVQSATVKLDEGTADVVYEDGSVGIDQLIAAVEEEGYKASLQSA